MEFEWDDAKSNTCFAERGFDFAYAVQVFLDPDRLVIAQVRGLLRQPEVMLGAWRAARASAPDMTEDEARLALERLDPLWEELFPAEQARIIHLLVDRVDIGPGGADVRLKLEGLGSLARDLAAPAKLARAAA